VKVLPHTEGEEQLFMFMFQEPLDSSSTVAKIFCFKISRIQAGKGGVALQLHREAVSRFL
jgi:hypothetical protein